MLRMHGLAEVDGAIRRGAADVLEVDRQQARVALDQHRDRAGALRRLAGAAALVLGDVGADDDRAAVLGLERQVTQRVLQRVDAAEARVLELGHLAVARERRAAARLQASSSMPLTITAPAELSVLDSVPSPKKPTREGSMS